MTDNRSENVKRVVKETLDSLNIHHVTTSYYHPNSNLKVERSHRTLHDILAKRLVLGWAYRGLTGGFLLLQNFSVAISVSPHVCFILVLILISMFLR